MDNNLSRIGNLIKRKRLEKGYSTQSLSKLLNISTGSLNNIENAKSDYFQLDLLNKLCSILALSPIELLVAKPSALTIFIEDKLIKDNLFESKLSELNVKIKDFAHKTNYDILKIDMLISKLISELEFIDKII